MITIGVLALQGSFAAHLRILRALEVESLEVRTKNELNRCDGLIIPGGESTTMKILMGDIWDDIKDYSKPIFGTCAGAILMGRENLNLLDTNTQRNAYGRQNESFTTQVSTRDKDAFECVFIRAPRIINIGSEVSILMSFDNSPILIQQGYNICATFHPELTNNTKIHKYFLELVTLFASSQA